MSDRIGNFPVDSRLELADVGGREVRGVEDVVIKSSLAAVIIREGWVLSPRTFREAVTVLPHQCEQGIEPGNAP